MTIYRISTGSSRDCDCATDTKVTGAMPRLFITVDVHLFIAVDVRLFIAVDVRLFISVMADKFGPTGYEQQ